MTRNISCLAILLMCTACGDGGGGGDGMHATVDVTGSIGDYKIERRGVQVAFKPLSGVDEVSMEMVPFIDGIGLSFTLVGAFTVGTHELDSEVNAWPQSSLQFWDRNADKSWYASSIAGASGYSPLAWKVNFSNAEDLSGGVSATLLGVGEEDGVNVYSATDTLEANLLVHVYGFGESQNAFGYEHAQAGGDVCHSNLPFTDDFGSGEICTETPCDNTASSQQDFQPGPCSDDSVKYGCCNIPDGTSAHVYNGCDTGNCESLDDWNVTCDQLGGVGRTGACP